VKPMSTEHKNFLQRTSNGNERATLAIENWPIEETQRQMMSWFLPWMTLPAFRSGLIGQGADTDFTPPIPTNRSRKKAPRLST